MPVDTVSLNVPSSSFSPSIFIFMFSAFSGVSIFSGSAEYNFSPGLSPAGAYLFHQYLPCPLLVVLSSDS